MHFSGLHPHLARNPCARGSTWRETRALAAALRAFDLQVCLHTTLFPHSQRRFAHLNCKFVCTRRCSRARSSAAARRYLRPARPARSSSLARTAALNAAASVIHGTCLPPIMLNGSSPLASKYTSDGRGSS